MEKILIGCISFFVALGKYLANNIPATIGIPNRINTVLAISQKLISIGITFWDAPEYRLPHNEKLKGVINTQTRVENADRLTDNSIFPLAKEVMKFDIFPPGHAATNSIPIATDGVGRITRSRRKVRNGSRNNWQVTPTIKLLGFCRTFLKLETLILNAMPNITNARMIFIMSSEPGVKFNLMESNTCKGCDDMSNLKIEN
jgi:hypothetical protein